MPSPTRGLVVLNWVVNAVLIVLAPIGMAAADIALLRWLFLAPGMEKSVLHTVSYYFGLWFIGVQGLAAVIGFALGAAVLIGMTAAMRPKRTRKLGRP